MHLWMFPNNKIGSYHVKFPQTIDLNGEREVGLYSISYSNTWYTLQNSQNHIYYSMDGGQSFWSSAIVDYGYYASMTELIKSINTAMKKELGNTNITSIYVYCNIVQPQIVGNTSVPLLRTIPVSENSGDVITKTFTNIQYVPVQTKSFEDIEILLRTHTGDPVPFERGKVIATLYFRKQSYFT